MPLCSVKGCSRPSRAGGLCHTHYARWLRHGSVHTVLRKQNSTHPHGGDGCSVKDCDGDFHCHGYCYKHYIRWKRHGDPLYSKIETKRAMVTKAIAWTSNKCLFWPWGTAGEGYAVMRLNGEMIYVSRLVCEQIHGAPPTPFHQTAHSCGKGHLGCIAGNHVRWATRAENEQDKKQHGTYYRGTRARMK